jgi:hypothetical protein
MTNSDTRPDEGGWQPIDEHFPRHLSAWILWDEEYDRPAVSSQHSTDGRFWAGDWDYEIKASLYLPYTPPPAPPTKDQPA